MQTFLDLFSGLGAFRLAFQPFFKCVWGCEIDKHARKTYADNFGEEPQGDDITQINTADIPYADVVVGGFPCQPWSILGRKQAFNDPRGLLYREVLRIVSDKRPRAFFLENVPGLKKYLPPIEEDFRRLGYSFSWRIIPASLVWPQKRRRLYMVGLRDGSEFVWPEIQQRDVNVYDLLEKEADFKIVPPNVWARLQRGMEREGRANAFSYHLLTYVLGANTICPTITTQRSSTPVLIPVPESLPRLLTIRELARIQGLPDSFLLPSSDRVAHKLIGNAVCIPIVEVLAKALAERLAA